MNPLLIAETTTSAATPTIATHVTDIVTTIIITATPYPQEGINTNPPP